MRIRRAWLFSSLAFFAVFLTVSVVIIIRGGDPIATADRAAEGIRTRGIDTDLDFYRSFELYQREPTEAALSLCVVDRSVIYKPATDTAPEQIIDDDQGSYFMQFRVVGDTPDELVIEAVVKSELVDLVGEYGQCEQYAT